MDPRYSKCWGANTGESLGNFRQAYANGQYNNLSVSQCIDSYRDEFSPGRGLFVLLADYNGVLSPDQILYGGSEPPAPWLDGMPYWMMGYGTTSFQDTLTNQFLAAPGYTWEASAFNIKVPLKGWMVSYDRAQKEAENTRSLEEYDLQRLKGILMNTTLDETTLRYQLRNLIQWHNGTWASEVQVHQNGTICTSNIASDVFTLRSVARAEGNFKVDRCLEFQGDEACQLRFSPAICLIVIVCNAIKAICMFLASKEGREETILTVGDGIASFLDRQDPYTRGYCLLSRNNIAEWSRSGAQSGIPRTLPRRKRWWQAVSILSWCTTSIRYVTFLV